MRIEKEMDIGIVSERAKSEQHIKDLQDKINKAKKKLNNQLVTPKELAAILEISYIRALKLTKVEGFPILQFGQSRLTVLSRLNDWLEDNVTHKFDL